MERLNRFAAHIESEGVRYLVHVPNSGRLRELLTPRAEVLWRSIPGPKRKTAGRLCLVKHRAEWVSIDSQLPNQLVRLGIARGAFPELVPFGPANPEFSIQKSRFDFVFPNAEVLLEVKSVTLVRGAQAMFPDSPTTRGTRHLRELTQLTTMGWRSLVLFIIQRADADFFTPNAAADPPFANAAVTAKRAGVGFFAYKCCVTPQAVAVVKPVPVRIPEVN